MPSARMATSRSNMGGTIINRRSDTTKQTLAKTWEAGSYQDQLADVEATFQLERILKEHATFDEVTGLLGR